VADGGFGDIGFQWSNVTVGGRVATLHSGLEIQPEVDGFRGVRCNVAKDKLDWYRPRPYRSG